jgi:hypothetical protein
MDGKEFCRKLSAGERRLLKETGRSTPDLNPLEEHLMLQGISSIHLPEDGDNSNVSSHESHVDSYVDSHTSHDSRELPELHAHNSGDNSRELQEVDAASEDEGADEFGDDSIEDHGMMMILMIMSRIANDNAPNS